MPDKDNPRWGSVDGDTNAEVIISDRSRGREIGTIVEVLFGFLALGSALWFGVTEDRWALAATIILTSWSVAATVTAESYKLFTAEMVTERRAQLLEQDMNVLNRRLNEMDDKLDQLLAELKPGSRQWEDD